MDKIDVRLARVDDYEAVRELHRPLGDYLPYNYHFYLSYRTNHCMVVTINGKVVSFGFISMLDGDSTVMLRGGRTEGSLRGRGLGARGTSALLHLAQVIYPDYKRERYVTNTRVIARRPQGAGMGMGGSEVIGRRMKMEFNFTNSHLLQHVVSRHQVAPPPSPCILLTSWTQTSSLLMSPETADRCFLPGRTLLLSRIPYQCGGGGATWHNLDIIRENENPTVFSDVDSDGFATSVSFATVFPQMDGGVTNRLDLDVYADDIAVATTHITLQLLHYLRVRCAGEVGRTRTHVQMALNSTLNRRALHDLCIDSLGMEYTSPDNGWEAQEHYDLVVFEVQRDERMGGKRVTPKL